MVARPAGRLDPAREIGMAVIYLIRHGQASFGDEEYDCLSRVGERQARILGHHFKRISPRLTAICSGGMKRQEHTAEITRETMGGSLPPLHTQEAFAEYDHVALFRAYLPGFFATCGESGPQTVEDLLADTRKLERALRHVLNAWMASESHEGPPVETWQEFCNRVCSGLLTLLHTQGARARVAVFTSGGAITAVLRTILGLSHKRTLGMNLSIYNASVTQVYCPGDGRLADALLLGYNNITHLEMTGDRDLITFR